MRRDIVNLFTYVPVIENKLKDDGHLNERSVRNVDCMTELSELGLTTSYFQFGDKFFQHNKRMAMGGSLSPAISNTYMECSEDMAMKRAVGKPSLWSRYVDGSFVVWEHINEDLHKLLRILNNIRTSNKFTVETEVNG